MNGYRILKQSGRLAAIANVKKDLTIHKLKIDGNFCTKLMGSGLPFGELITRQYLLILLAGINLNKALLLTAGKSEASVVFPLPLEWRRIIARHGFRVAHFRSSLLWGIYILTLLFFGVGKIIKIIFNGQMKKKVNQKSTPYIYFVDLSSGNLPQIQDKESNYDVISWYLRWGGRKRDIESIHHGVISSNSMEIEGIKVSPQHDILPALDSGKKIFEFLLWALAAILISSFDLLRGRWWHALLLNQAALSAQTRLVDRKSLAREYFFHNSNWIYRPLWTYAAQERGCDISFYFYSTNCEEFVLQNRSAEIPYGWRAMSWPHYLVWDQWQKAFIKKAIGKSGSIEIVGPINFQASPANLPALPVNLIAIFDVQPVRNTIYITLGLPYEYYVASTANSFIEDLFEVCKKNNLIIAHKRKRDIGKSSHPSYRNKLKKINQEQEIINIDPTISPMQLILRAKAVVSMPFTSTAILAKAVGKPSVYYDATSLCKDNDPAAHGIPILRGRIELEAWMGRLSD